MVLSMTGYGRAEQERSGRDITVEIKSVNSRYFEYTSRMPRSFAFLDDKLKKLVNATISRGKTELALTVVNIGAPEASISVNLDLAKGYLDAIGEMSSALGVENDVTAGTLTRFSDIFTTRKAETDEEQLWADVKAVAEAAVENFVAMRAAEGEKLRADILSRLVYLEQAVGEIEQTSAERVQKYTEKLYAKLKALLEDTNIDEARILTEAAIFADKTAVDEETVRLRSHLSQLEDMLEKFLNDDVPVGDIPPDVHPRFGQVDEAVGLIVHIAHAFQRLQRAGDGGAGHARRLRDGTGAGRAFPDFLMEDDF